MIKKDQETSLHKLLDRQKELRKRLKKGLGDYYYFKEIADELENTEEELYDNKVFGIEDIPTSLEEDDDDTRNCERIYYLLAKEKRDNRRLY